MIDAIDIVTNHKITWWKDTSIYTPETNHHVNFFSLIAFFQFFKSIFTFIWKKYILFYYPILGCQCWSTIYFWSRFPRQVLFRDTIVIRFHMINKSTSTTSHSCDCIVFIDIYVHLCVFLWNNLLRTLVWIWKKYFIRLCSSGLWIGKYNIKLFSSLTYRSHWNIWLTNVCVLSIHCTTFIFVLSFQEWQCHVCRSSAQGLVQSYPVHKQRVSINKDIFVWFNI